LPQPVNVQACAVRQARKRLGGGGRPDTGHGEVASQEPQGTILAPQPWLPGVPMSGQERRHRNPHARQQQRRQHRARPDALHVPAGVTGNRQAICRPACDFMRLPPVGCGAPQDLGFGNTSMSIRQPRRVRLCLRIWGFGEFTWTLTVAPVSRHASRSGGSGEVPREALAAPQTPFDQPPRPVTISGSVRQRASRRQPVGPAVLLEHRPLPDRAPA
jgi:hypothetical protein